MGPQFPQPKLLSLCDAYCGDRLRIVQVPQASEQATRLRELGFCERAEVTKLADGSALLCVVCGVRLAIGRDLGASILVQKVA